MFYFKGNFRIGFASKRVAGSVSTLCNPPYTENDKPVEVRDWSAIWVTREWWKTDYKFGIALMPKTKNE